MCRCYSNLAIRVEKNIPFGPLLPKCLASSSRQIRSRQIKQALGGEGSTRTTTSKGPDLTTSLPPPTHTHRRAIHARSAGTQSLIGLPGLPVRVSAERVPYHAHPCAAHSPPGRMPNHGRPWTPSGRECGQGRRRSVCLPGRRRRPGRKRSRAHTLSILSFSSVALSLWLSLRVHIVHRYTDERLVGCSRWGRPLGD